MQLLFRGVHYEDTPTTLEVVEGEVGGVYRGSPWRVHRLIESPRRTRPHEFIYRGIRYSK